MSDLAEAIEPEDDPNAPKDKENVREGEPPKEKSEKSEKRDGSSVDENEDERAEEKKQKRKIEKESSGDGEDPIGRGSHFPRFLSSDPPL